MPTFIDGQVNLAGLTNPGVYIDIIPPQPFVTGAPTNIQALVGVAQWGPVAAPIPFSTPDECAGIFGLPAERSFDMPTFVWAASQVGGNIAFRGVRVTDGTDVAAAAVIQTNGVTITSKYTGSRGNQITFSIRSGTAASTYAAVITFPGRIPETFTNISGSGNAFWVNLALAINIGTSLRGPSNYVVATAGASTAAPTITTTPIALTAGTDGDGGVVASTLLGQDTSPRKGMYALRKTGCDCAALCGVTDPTTWAAQNSFGLSEDICMIMTTTSGDSITGAVVARTSAGLDDFMSWLVAGDWPTFYDTANNKSRLVSPQAFGIGLCGNLSPEQSPLNKNLRGVVATQRSTAGLLFSDAEIAVAELGGIDIICPSGNTPGGNYFSFLTGRNASSNTAANGIEYTRMTFFLARSLQSTATGSFIGRTQSIRADDKTRQKATFVLDSFFQGLIDLEMIDQFSVQCDELNNPPNLVAQGFLFAYCAVRYLGIVRYFVIKLAGGSNVTVTSQFNQPSPAQFT